MAGRRTGSLDIGDVIGKTFAVWFRNLVPFTVIALVMYSPAVLLQYMIAHASVGDRQRLSALAFVVNQGLSYVVAGALTYGVLQSLRGKPVGIGPCISKGLSRLFPVLGVSILTALCVGVGLILLVVPGIIFMCMLAVAVPVAVIEEPGVLASLKRSAALTEGSRVTIFLVYVVITVLSAVFGFVLGMLALGAGELGALLMTAVMLAFAGALGGAIPAVIYHDLRTIKEGVSVEEVAKVFD